MVNQSEIENETTASTPSSTSTTIPEMPKIGGGNMILVLPNGKGNGSFTSFSFGPPSNPTNQQHTTTTTSASSSTTNTSPPSTANTTTTNPTRSNANYFPTHQNPNPTIFLPESSSSTTRLTNSPLNIIPTNETHTSTTTTTTTTTSTSMTALPEPMLPSTEPPISNLPPFQIPLPHYSHDNNDNNDNDNDNDNDNTDNLNDTTNDNDSKSDDDSDMIDHTHPMSLLLPPSHTGVYQSSLLNSASNSENNMDNTPIRRSTRNRVPTRALLASQNINKRSNSKQSKKGQKGKARASSGDSSLLVSVMNHTLDISLLTDLDSTSDHHYAPHTDSTDIGERLSLYNLARMWVADNPSATLSHAEDVLMDIKANVHNEEPHMELPAPLEVSDFTRAKPPTNMKTSPQDFDRLIRSNHGSNDTTRSLLDGHLSFYKTIRGWSQGQYNFRLSRYKERLEIITKDMSEM